MIPKNKVRAVSTIIPGLILFIVAVVLSRRIPNSSLVFDVIAIAGHIIYIWGCYNLLLGKGQSKWYMVLIFIPIIPSLIIFILLRDRHKHLDDASLNKKLNLAIALSVSACIWFGSIALLYATMEIFAVPTLAKLALKPISKQVLPAIQTSGDEIYLMGLKVNHPVQGLNANIIAPMFENNLLEGVSIFLNKGNTHECNILIYKYPDDMSVKCGFMLPSNKIINTIIMFNGSRYDLIDKMMRADVSDFSWWNLLYDIRLVYVLVNKAIYVPIYCEKRPIFSIKTDYLSGYLLKGKLLKRNIQELLFAENGYFYNVVILDKNNRDFSEFLSNLSVASESDEAGILNSYSKRSVSKDIELASRLSRKVTLEDLGNCIALIEQHKAAGEKTPNFDFHKELLYLKSINK
jgi:hypothetical protein